MQVLVKDGTVLIQQLTLTVFIHIEVYTRDV